MYDIKKINKIRSMYYDEGMKIIDICRRTNISANTIRRFIKTSDFNKEVKINRNLYRILPYEDEIKKLIKLDRSSHHKQRLTAKRVYELLKEKYPDYPCSYYTTRKFYQKTRLEFFSLSKQYIPLIHKPGNAQVDFGEIYYLQNDIKLKAYILTVAFPYSNAFYCQLFIGKTSECML